MNPSNPDNGLSDSQLIRKLETFTQTYLHLLNSAPEEEQVACKKIIDEIVEEYTRRKNQLNL